VVLKRELLQTTQYGVWECKVLVVVCLAPAFHCVNQQNNIQITKTHMTTERRHTTE